VLGRHVPLWTSRPAHRRVYDRRWDAGWCGDGPDYFRHAVIVAALALGIRGGHGEEFGGGRGLRGRRRVPVSSVCCARFHIVVGQPLSLASVSSLISFAGSLPPPRSRSGVWEHPKWDQLQHSLRARK